MKQLNEGLYARKGEILKKIVKIEVKKCGQHRKK